MNNTILSLVGNPNVGKTTLFNMLTGSFEHTGNWHGVTVDEKEKSLTFEGNKYTIVDLPGLYSTTSFSPEEQVSIDYLLNHRSLVLNVCDANVLERNLYLTISLMEMGLSPILVINFDSEIKKRGTRYDYKKLSNSLNIDVIVNNYKKSSYFLKNINTKNRDVKKISLPYISRLPLDEVLSILSLEQKNKYNFDEFLAIKILENDENILNSLSLSDDQKKSIKNITSRKDYVSFIATLRYNYINELLDICTISKKDTIYGSHPIDKILLNKYLALPIFFLILCTIFFITFSSLGAFLSEGLKYIIDNYIGAPLHTLLLSIGSPKWIVALVGVGIIGGVGGLFSFIPQIVLLFFFLSLLEESGYISRLAFSFEEIFYKFGLSGKSVFTLLMSFGCTTSSVMTTRTIEDKNTRIKTAMISPYMSCSAKLPIYAVIGGAFFGKGNIFIIVSLYILGVIVALLVSRLLSKRVLKSNNLSFILEFPPYRMPSLKHILVIIYENCKTFIVKVATILLSFSVIVFILQNFSFSFQYIPSTIDAKSILQVIGETLSVLLAPIGLNNWGIVVSLLVGIMAKEMVVGTMAIINKVPPSLDFNKSLGLSLMSSSFVINLSPATAVVMMVFSLLYFPCISTIAVLKKEIGLKWTILSCLIQLSIAYFISFILFNLLTGGIVTKVILSIATILAIVMLFVHSFKLSKDKGPCAYCSKNCKRCV